MAAHLNIVGPISESVEQKMRDKSWKVSEKKYKEVLGSFFFLMTEPGSIAQVLLLWAKREAIERLF